MKPISIKTYDEWYAEAVKYAQMYYERYADAWSDFNCPDDTRNKYCHISKNYMQLADVLNHIKLYGSIYEPTKCSACKYNDKLHSAPLEKVYTKYKKWIDRLAYC